MRIWPVKRREQTDRRTDTDRDRSAREYIARTAAAEAERQRRERDQAVSPEHRANEAERRESAARWNQPTRWLTPVWMTDGQHGAYQVRLALADRWPLVNRGRW